MPSATFLMQIDRHAVWGSRPVGACILLGLAGLIAAGVLLEPGKAEPQAAIQPAAAIDDAVAASRCVPHDAALGNKGGDPFGFYVFSRDQERTWRGAGSCTLDVAESPDERPAARVGPGYETLAQN
ncbi:MAG TPA: hypothetical protein VH743_14055 [Beijerinckiaceae bacterium]